MKKVFAVFAATLLIGSYSYAVQGGQQSTTKASADAKSQGEVKTERGDVTLDAGSQINAEMASTINLKTAKPGDQFKMKTTRPVKSQGKDIVSRGSTISGHVEQVTRADNTTKATLVFDQLEDKKTHLTSPLSAVVTAVTKAENKASAMAGEDTMAAASPRGSQQTRTRQSSSQQSGGLLGGVTQTAGGVVGQVSSTVDSTAGATLGANSGVAGAGGLTRGAIQIVSDTTANTTSSSTLALSDRNPKIESGTQFVLQTTSALMLTKEPKQK